MRTRLNILAYLLIAVAAASCHRIPLYDEGAGMYIHVDIDYAIDNCDNLPEPETMSINLYDVASNKCVTQAFTGAQGGYVHAPAGKFNILIYNFDTDYTIIENDGHFQRIEAATGRVPGEITNRFRRIRNAIAQRREESRTDGNTQARAEYDNDPLVNQPDHLFVAHVDNQDIPHRISDDEVFNISAHASSIVETYRLELTHITGMANIRSIGAFITGLTEAVSLGELEPAGGPATIYVPLARTAEGSSIVSTFNTFGRYPASQGDSYAVIYIMNDGGEEFVYEYDITDQFDNKEANGHTIIVNLPIYVEASLSDTSSGGWDPTVEEWGGEIINIQL